MPISLPPTTDGFAKQVVLVTDTAPANPSAPTKAEFNAMTFVACHVYGRVNAQPQQSVVDGPRKGCSRVAPKRGGIVTYPEMDISASYMPQELGTPGAEGNELYELAVPGSTLYVYFAEGLDGKTSALATGDVVNQGYEVEAFERRTGVTDDGEGGEANFMQLWVPQGDRLLLDYVTPAS